VEQVLKAIAPWSSDEAYQHVFSDNVTAEIKYGIGVACH